MDAATVEGAIAIAEAVVEAIIKVAPQIEQGVISSIPYVEVIAGLIKGNNATLEDIQAHLADANAKSAEFQKPLPLDDGTTTT